MSQYHLALLRRVLNQLNTKIKQQHARLAQHERDANEITQAIKVCREHFHEKKKAGSEPKNIATRHSTRPVETTHGFTETK